MWISKDPRDWMVAAAVLALVAAAYTCDSAEAAQQISVTLKEPPLSWWEKAGILAAVLAAVATVEELVRRRRS